MILRFLLASTIVSSCMAQALVQSANAHTFTATASVAFGSPNASGCLLVASVLTTTNSAPTVSDTKGNTYHSAVYFWDTGTGTGIDISYAYNCTAGANTVTVSVTGATNTYVLVSEWSGVLSTSDPLDNATAIGGYAGTPTVTLTDGTASDVAYGILYNGSSTGTNGTGFTLVQNPWSNGIVDEYKSGVSSGSVPVTFSLSGGGGWNAAAAAFKPASAPVHSAVHPRIILF